MNEISTKELFTLYLDTLERGCIRTRNLKDEAVGHNIYAEFDTGIRSFLHDTSLERLHKAGYIDDEVLKFSRTLHKIAIPQLEKRMTIAEIRTDWTWCRVMNLAEKIIHKIQAKGGEPAEIARRERQRWNTYQKIDASDPGYLPCLCCGALEIDERGGYLICQVCNWEDDPVQASDPDYSGGANTLSLNQARKQWKEKQDKIP